MPVVKTLRPLTPFQWLRSQYRGRDLAKLVGREVLMIEPGRISGPFVIERVDAGTGKVWWTLPGVFVGVEWKELDKDSTYELAKLESREKRPTTIDWRVRTDSLRKGAR